MDAVKTRTGLARLAKEVALPSDSARSEIEDLSAESARSGSQGFFQQLRDGLFGVLFVMAKETHVVKRQHIILLSITMIQVRVLLGMHVRAELLRLPAVAFESAFETALSFLDIGFRA